MVDEREESRGPEGPSVWTAELRAARISCGAGVADTLGECAKRLGGSRVLVVTDPGIERAGHVERALQSLAAAGLAAVVFDGVRENPTEKHVAAGVEAARKASADLLVGLGGGSSMDCAKGINFLLTNGGRMEDYLGYGKASLPMLPSIGVPSTAGTGSEAQSYALISRARDHRKMACGDQKARFGHVLLDPLLARTAPREVIAVTGLDALSHAVESLVSKPANPFSRMWSRAAWERLSGHFETVLAGDAAPADWQEMQVGAYFSGAAVEASMLGAAHALANPLTAVRDVTHGIAVSIVLPAVVRWNGETEVVAERYAELEQVAGPAELAARMEAFAAAAGIPGSLQEVGFEESELPELAQAAAEQWTGSFNPRPVDAQALRELYRQCL